jgi:hypothetical protein
VKISLHPEADEEFAGAVAYYSEISPELGIRFYREWNVCFWRLQQIHNASGNLIHQRAGTSVTIFPTQSFSWINQTTSTWLP